MSFPLKAEKYDIKSSLKFKANADLLELGDIAIAYEVCKKEADISKIAFEHHVYHLIIHSILHLLGKIGKAEEKLSVIRKYYGEKKAEKNVL